MKYLFHPSAKKELADAADFYEAQRINLGQELSQEVQATITQICESPGVWEKLDAYNHRCLTNRFPYGIIYRIEPDHIRIMAVMHLSRKPDYWKNR
jgi:plasmid stabilization system protein ParE